MIFTLSSQNLFFFFLVNCLRSQKWLCFLILDENMIQIFIRLITSIGLTAREAVVCVIRTMITDRIGPHGVLSAIKKKLRERRKMLPVKRLSCRGWGEAPTSFPHLSLYSQPVPFSALLSRGQTLPAGACSQATQNVFVQLILFN